MTIGISAKVLLTFFFYFIFGRGKGGLLSASRQDAAAASFPWLSIKEGIINFKGINVLTLVLRWEAKSLTDVPTLILHLFFCPLINLCITIRVLNIFPPVCSLLACNLSYHGSRKDDWALSLACVSYEVQSANVFNIIQTER